MSSPRTCNRISWRRSGRRPWSRWLTQRRLLPAALHRRTYALDRHGRHLGPDMRVYRVFELRSRGLLRFRRLHHRHPDGQGPPALPGWPSPWAAWWPVCWPWSPACPPCGFKGAYFAIGTWAFNRAAQQFVLVLDLTGGPEGMRLPPFLNPTYFSPMSCWPWWALPT